MVFIRRLLSMGLFPLSREGGGDYVAKEFQKMSVLEVKKVPRSTNSVFPG